MEVNIDIRRITLIKRYRPEQIDEKQFGWYVFGYYDRMNVKEIPIDNAYHPLETILADAQKQSLSNSASTKQHVIYAIGAEQNTLHKEFWKSAEQYPLLLVSLIHLNHPLSSFSDTNISTQQTNFINQYINSIKKTIKGKQNKDIRFSLYFSIDCNDLIVFWSATSFQRTMELIAQVCACDSSRIGELFTIQACANTIMYENNAMLNIWKQNEPVFQCIRIHLRSKNFFELLTRVADIPQDIEKRKMTLNTTVCSCHVKEYVVPGQDDVVLAFQNIPLDWLLDMYAPSVRSEDGCKDSLCGLLYEGILSRTVIDTELVTGNKSQPPQKEQGTPLDSNLSANVKERIDRLSECIQKNNFNRTTWLPALYELLFELANFETSSTAYDIYVQAAPCHNVLVEELIERIKSKSDEAIELQQPNTTVVRNIQQYLQGWSQLSFHAMHAEWQLTQTSEMNRLYIFPAKLNRLYSAFMDSASEILNAGCESTPARANLDSASEILNAEYKPSPARANFFLTPTIGSEAEFTAIFKPSNKACSLVLGEIPADLMFAPQLFLPLLVHEAAHYAGHEHRMRPLRYTAILRSTLFYVLSSVFEDELIYMPIQKEDGTSTVGVEIVEKLVASFPNFEDPKNNYARNRLDNVAYYSEDIRKHIGFYLCRILANSTGYLQPAVQDVLYSIPFFEYFDYMQMDIYYHSQTRTNQHIVALQAYGTDRHIYSYLDQLLTIYSESFSDLCMIRLLDLRIEEYLRVIFRNNRYSIDPHKDQPTLSTWSIASLSERVRYERYLCVIMVAYPTFSLSDLLKHLDIHSESVVIDSGKKITRSDMQGIYALASALEVINSQENPEVKSCAPYARGQLLVYLDAVSRELSKAIQASQQNADSPEMLKQIYQTLAFNMQFFYTGANSIIDLLTPCIKMMHDTSSKLYKD